MMSYKKDPSDPLKTYWEKRAQELPHFKPAHETQGREYSIKVPNVSGPVPGVGNIADRDISDLLKQRIASRAMEAQVGGGESKQVDLKEGFKYYTVLQSGGYGHTITLVKTGGITGGQSARGVFVKKERKCLVVDGMTAVNMSAINEQSPNVVVLVEVTVPLIGTFFVQREAIIPGSVSNGVAGSRQLLKG